MDDWGSPWADEIQIERSIKEQEDRPVTPVKASNLAFDNEGKQLTSSPWDDAKTSSLGEWGFSPKADNNGFDCADDGWAVDAVKDGGVADKFSTHNVNSIHEGKNLQLFSALPSVHAELARKTSDDSWVHNTATRKSSPADSGDSKKESEFLRSSIPALADEVPSGTLIHQLITLDGEKYTAGVGVLLNKPGEKSGELSHSQTSKQQQEIEHVPSRPSSSPSEHSQHDELSQESPRTSIDDEPTRPQIPRKTSTTVQALVAHFDDLAKQESIQSSDGQNQSLRTNVVLESSREELEDFGDFEEGQSDVEESYCLDLKREATTQSLSKENESIEFNIDSSAFDKIYADRPMEASKAVDVFLTDTIPCDSFSTTEQRKLWYRVSRYGSMRKHNNGDDEKYGRVNWAHSKVREETLKIVGRWMDEDHISGRVVLGGSHKGSSIFGWNNTKATPLPLSQAFPEKRQKTSMGEQNTGIDISRKWQKSLARNQPTQNTFQPSLAEPILKAKAEEPKTFTEPPVANFGWSSSLEGSQIQNNQPFSESLSLSNMPTTAASTRSTFPNLNINDEINGNLKLAQAAPTLLTVSHSQGKVPSQPTLVPMTISEDDCWTDMISSPSTATHSFFPLAHGVPHKKSQSLGGLSALQPPQARSTVVQPNRSSMTATSQAGSLLIQPRSPTSSDDVITKNLLSGSSQNSSGAQEIEVMETGGLSATSGNPDPWASVDFSFFEERINPGSEAAVSFKPPKSVTFGDIMPHVPLPPNQKFGEEIEQDRIVQSVVKNLPDLSYMLRK